MLDTIKISQLEFATKLTGEEYFITNQEDADKLIETRLASINQLINYFKSNIDNLLNLYTPTGTVQVYPGDIDTITDMPGWLLCDGSQISNKKYFKLYDIIKNKYAPPGSIISSDKFYLPDLKGKLIMGFCNLNTPFKPNTKPGDGPWQYDAIKIGDVYGKYSHKLLDDELPRHTHNISNHSHDYFDFFKYNNLPDGSAHDNETYRMYINQNDCELINKNIKQHRSGKQADLKYYSDTTNINTSNPNGGYEYHNNVQPSIIMNYIIKT
jgi:microcystin-dependent protein